MMAEEESRMDLKWETCSLVNYRLHVRENFVFKEELFAGLPGRTSCPSSNLGTCRMCKYLELSV
jgi:hypothetical protein